MTPKLKIYIIEDDLTMQTHLSALLKKAGHEIIGVSTTGTDGLNAIALQPPDLIVIDIGLPDIDGIEVMKRLQITHPLPIIVVSSEERIEKVECASEAGALAYIVKPPDLPQIERAIAIAVVQFKYTMQMRSLNELLILTIDERKNTELKLSESERKFRTLTENTADIIIRHDNSGKCLYANPAFEKCLNITINRIIGNSLAAFIDNQSKLLLCESALEKVIISGTGTHFEITFNNPDRIYDWIMIPEFDELGKVISVISTIRDTTELRDAQDRLYQLEKMQAIGQLAGGIAHDFNNKLGAILGYADILLDSLPDDDRRKKYVDAIVKASQFASDLTTQLLAYARKGKIKNIILDMHQIIDELVRFLTSSFDKKVIIKKNLNAKTPFIFGDPLLLKNAFLNVALNANDAMPEGGTLTFETDMITFSDDFKLLNSSQLTPGEYLHVSIKDTGTGISNDDLGRIFEPFFTTKEPGIGTGLGLPAVFGIVKSHAGAIDVKSEPGKGSSFEIYFPAAASEDFYHHKEIKLGESNGLPTILVVDDNELIREMAAEMLNKLGYNVIVCRSGNEAVKLYEIHSDKIDLALIDIIMPGIDGYETYTQLRNLNSSVKAFFISGYNVNEKTNQFIAEGVLGIIPKPFRINEIKHHLDTVFHSNQNTVVYPDIT